MTEADESIQVPDPERLQGDTHWTYEQLLTKLRSAIIYGEEIPLAEFPTTVDFGEIAQRTQVLATTQLEDPTKAERASYLGAKIISGEYLNSAVIAGTANKIEGLTPIKAFPSELKGSVSPLFLQHSHLFGVFSPTDLITLQYSRVHPAGMSVGVAPAEDYGSGFTLYAIRSRETQTFLESYLSSSRSEGETFLRRVSGQRQRIEQSYPDAALIIREVLHGSGGHNKPLDSLTGEEAQRLSAAHDFILRQEAQANNIVVYIAPWGASTARRCDLTRPTLDQLPKA